MTTVRYQRGHHGRSPGQGQRAGLLLTTQAGRRSQMRLDTQLLLLLLLMLLLLLNAGGRYGLEQLLPQPTAALFNTLQLGLEQPHLLLQGLYARVFRLHDGGQGGATGHAAWNRHATSEDGTACTCTRYATS